MVGSSCWEGYAFSLISTLFNLMHLFPVFCCKLYVFKNQGKFNHVYVVHKGWTHKVVWMRVIFGLLQGQTLHTTFVTAVLF